MSYSQYYQWQGDIKGRDSILCTDYVLDPTRVLMKDPCPASLPEILTRAQMAAYRDRLGPQRISDLGTTQKPLMLSADVRNFGTNALGSLTELHMPRYH